MSLEKLGRWEGDVFIFHKPIQLGDGTMMERLNFDTFVSEDDISREEVITAMANNPIVIPRDVPDSAP
jgi:recombinational DNA repair protein RecR